MGVYQKGNTVVVDTTFDVHGVLTNPTTVTFRLLKPTGETDVFVYGVASEVTNPSVGLFELTLAPTVLDTPGIYNYRAEGTGTCEAADEGDFTVSRSAVLDLPYAPPPPAPGPCQPWCDPQDVAAVCGSADVGSDTGIFEVSARAASELLFELSGHQFPGVCEQTVRPTRDGCGCWQWLTWPASPGVPQLPYSLTWGWWGPLGWGWGFEGCSEAGGCGTLSRALLPDYPVFAIVEVLVDGVVMPEVGTDGAKNWRLDGWRWLTRMADANGLDRFWPVCQDLNRPLTSTGTWGVTYRSGRSVPELGVMAAAQLACELHKAWMTGSCSLPAATTRVNRQGIQVERPPFISWALQSGRWATGLTLVDAFLSAYNPAGHKRTPSVWSPDVPEYADRVGLGQGE